MSDTEIKPVVKTDEQILAELGRDRELRHAFAGKKLIGAKSNVELTRIVDGNDVFGA